MMISMEKSVNKDCNAFLNKYIPSRDMRSKILETGHVFTDWDRATIIWNSDVPLEEKHCELQKIAEGTSDEALRAQISERLDYDSDALKYFSERAEGYVYALTSHEFAPDDVITGYFAAAELAHCEGCRSGFDFYIAKHQIVDENTVRIKDRILHDPAFGLEEPDLSEETAYYDRGVAGIEYDKEGHMFSYWSNELPADRAIKVETLSNKRFENRFVVFPEVFKTGEKVRIIADRYDEGEEVWIAPTIWDYDEFIWRATAPDSIEEYMDVAIPVTHGDKEGERWHVNPIHLERVIDDAEDRSATDDEVLSIAEELFDEYKETFEKLAE